MAKERSSAKMAGWLGGIAATVISGYLLWYFEQPKPTPPPLPPPAVTTFEGMVYSGDAPVAKALVAVDLTGNAGANGAIHDITDDNGAYKIELTGLPDETGATVSVVAKGFEDAAPKVLAIPLTPDERIDIPLSPAAASSTAAPVPETPTHKNAAQGAVKHRPEYRPKSAAQATKFRFGAKEQP